MTNPTGRPPPDVYYCTSDRPLVIVTAWRPDPLGGPAIRQTTIMLKYGDGIDLSILPLSRTKPLERKK